GLAGINSFAWKIFRGASVASTERVTVGAGFACGTADFFELFCALAGRIRKFKTRRANTVRFIKSIFICQKPEDGLSRELCKHYNKNILKLFGTGLSFAIPLL